MADNVPLSGAKGTVKKFKARKNYLDRDVAGDVLVPAPEGGVKIGNPDTTAPPPQSVDDVIGDQPLDTRKARYRNPVRLTPDEIRDLADRLKKLADDDLDTPIG